MNTQELIFRKKGGGEEKIEAKNEKALLKEMRKYKKKEK